MSERSKPTRSHRLTMIFIVGILIFIATVIFSISRTPNLPVTNPDVDFTYYEPSYLPPNVSIKAKKIFIIRHELISVGQNFRTEDWVYAIRESRVNANESIGTANQDYDSKSVKPTCNIQFSSAGAQYRVCHWIDYGRIDVHEIKFVKNGTFIYAQIPTTLAQQINLPEVDKFVDSFERKSARGLPVLRSEF